MNRSKMALAEYSRAFKQRRMAVPCRLGILLGTGYSCESGMHMHMPPWELLGAVQCAAPAVPCRLGMLLGTGYSCESGLHMHMPPRQLLADVR